MSEGPGKIVTFLLVFSVILQLASIASPGWHIDIIKNQETYDSVFYKVTCETLKVSNCFVNSFMDSHYDRLHTVKDTEFEDALTAEIEREYNGRIVKQVFVIVALVCTLAAVYAQVRARRTSEQWYNKLNSAATMFLGVSGGLVLDVICQDIIFTVYKMDIRSFDSDADHTYIGFPYSLAMYIGAFVIILIVLLILVTEGCKRTKSRSNMIDELGDIDRSRPVYKPTDVEKDVGKDLGEDNYVFSEKL